MRVWPESECGGEVYIPLDPEKRRRSLEVWESLRPDDEDPS